MKRFLLTKSRRVLTFYGHTQNFQTIVVSYRIHKKPICPEHFTDNIERKYFRSALKRILYNKMNYSKQIVVLGRPGGGEVALPYKRLMGRLCRWMGSHFHDRTEYSGVAFSKELLEWGRTFSDFWGKRVVHIYG